MHTLSWSCWMFLKSNYSCLLPWTAVHWPTTPGVYYLHFDHLSWSMYCCFTNCVIWIALPSYLRGTVHISFILTVHSCTLGASQHTCSGNPLCGNSLANLEFPILEGFRHLHQCCSPYLLDGLVCHLCWQSLLFSMNWFEVWTLADCIFLRSFGFWARWPEDRSWRRSKGKLLLLSIMKNGENWVK